MGAFHTRVRKQVKELFFSQSGKVTVYLLIEVSYAAFSEGGFQVHPALIHQVL
jgi:hypothetical protein